MEIDVSRWYDNEVKRISPIIEAELQSGVCLHCPSALADHIRGICLGWFLNLQPAECENCRCGVVEKPVEMARAGRPGGGNPHIRHREQVAISSSHAADQMELEI